MTLNVEPYTREGLRAAQELKKKQSSNPEQNKISEDSAL